MPTEQDWELAKSDGVILEEKIAQLVEEFEQKHKPIQVNVLTRLRDWKDLYSLSKGGAAQIKLHDSRSTNGGFVTSGRTCHLEGIDEIVYSED